jgi:hypothetical protein
VVWRGAGGAEPSGDSRGAAERLGRRRGSRCSPRRAPRAGEGPAPEGHGAMGCIGSRTVGGYRGWARAGGRTRPRVAPPTPSPIPVLAPPGTASRLHFPTIRPRSLHPSVASLRPPRSPVAPPGLPSLLGLSLLSIALPQALPLTPSSLHHPPSALRPPPPPSLHLQAIRLYSMVVPRASAPPSVSGATPLLRTSLPISAPILPRAPFSSPPPPSF